MPSRKRQMATIKNVGSFAELISLKLDLSNPYFNDAKYKLGMVNTDFEV